MTTTPSPYRPHTAGHDYKAAAIYHITLCVRERRRLLGELNDNEEQPAVALTATGRIVAEEWAATERAQRSLGRRVRVLAHSVMPDHTHAVIEVEEAMDVGVGRVMIGFKSACTARWRREVTSYVPGEEERAALRRMSAVDREAYFALRPFEAGPLFDSNYDDTICLSARHREAMVRYVLDNPLRAIVRRLRPEFMRRRQHISICGRDYCAFGNIFLLRWARKIPVMVHRRTETTEPFLQARERLERRVMEGQTVVVTPGISPGELIIKNMCLVRGYPLIHIQAGAMGERWKPEASRFNACATGRLLILAPLAPQELGAVNGVPSDTAYSVFHNLNTLAREIAAFEGDALLRGEGKKNC